MISVCRRIKAHYACTYRLTLFIQGFAGLAVAKTFHQLNPAKSLVVFDSGLSLGGTWAKERLYPGLKTNNMLGTYEYPDFPMDPQTFGVQPGQHIPGRVCHEYLSAYAAKFGIADKIRYSSRVLVAEHLSLSPDGGWVLTVATTTTQPRDGQPSEEQTSQIRARKLVVSTGLTSAPFRPRFEGEETFGGLIFHSKEFLQHAGTLEDATKRVTVFGATKSAWDMVYAYATKGIQVDWVIRSSGHGPSWMAPAYVTPLKKWLEKLVMTRALTWFSPCAWGSADGYAGMRQFLHGTAVGRAVTNKFWDTLGNDVKTLNQFDAHPEVAKLKPWSHPMFVASSFSILNYETDFFELVRNGSVRVHVADIVGLGPRRVDLSDGTHLDADILCCVTGWRMTPPLRFLPEGIEKDLGVPRRVPADDDMHELTKRADDEILRTWPRLRDPPVQNKNLVPLAQQKGIVELEDGTQGLAAAGKLSAWTLYRFMVPPAKALLASRDVAFAGMLMNFNVPMTAHFQALWIHAFFAGRGLAFPQWTVPEELDKLRYSAVLHARFGKWRYPAGHGDQYPDFVFDALPYIDLLAGDLGLQVHRKGGKVAEMSEPYGPEDYRTVVEEWKAQNPS